VTLAKGHSSISDCPLLFNGAMQFVFLDRFAISSNNFSYQRPVLEYSILFLMSECFYGLAADRQEYCFTKKNYFYY